MTFTEAAIPIFKATDLAPQLARKAYTLVRLANPSVNLKTWMHHVHAFTKTGSGWIAIVDARSYVHGVFAWSLLHDLTHQKALRISDVTIAELPGHALQHALFLGCVDKGDSQIM
jgi:hypothetical protein